MNIELVTDVARLAALAPAWNDLSGGSPLLSHEWMSLWWKHYGAPAEREGRAALYVLAAWEGDRLAGLAPWYLARGRSGWRRLRSMGSGEVCTDYLTILTAPGRLEPAVDGVAQFLLPERGRPARGAARWQALDFDGVDAADPAMRRFCDALAARGGLLHVCPGLSTWRIDLPATWDEYAQAFSKSRRRQLKLWQAEFDAGRMHAHVARTPDELQHGWPIFVDLHQRRRESLGEPGCFASPQFAAFHAEVASALLESGRVQLTWIERNGQPLASEYMLVGGGVAYCYQSGIEPAAFQRQPGHMAVFATIRRAIEQGLTGYDFMRGDEPYKARWHAAPRVSLRIRALPGRAIDYPRRECWKLYDGAKAWWRGASRATQPAAAPPEPILPSVPELQPV